MARKTLFKPRRAGYRELLTSPEVVADIQARADRVAAAAGPGHDVRNTTTNRARATVMTISDMAVIAEATEHALTKAIPAAGG